MGEGKVIPTHLPDILRTAEFEGVSEARNFCMEALAFVISTTQREGNRGLNLQYKLQRTQQNSQGLGRAQAFRFGA